MASMKMLLATTAMLSSLLLLGCKNEVERMVELEEIKAAGYEKAGDDCNKIAAALEDFNKTHGKEHKEIMAKLKEKYPTKADGEKVMEKYKDRIDKNSPRGSKFRGDPPPASARFARAHRALLGGARRGRG